MTAPKDIRPFLAFTAQPTRPLGAMLPSLATPEVTSPWTPRAAVEPPAGPSTAELAALVDQARDQGRAEGLAETAALRGQLAAAIDQLVAARAAIVAPTAEAVAEVCGCVIEAWIDAADRAALFAPIVRAWLAASTQPATARVHPADVAALAPLIGEAPIAIVGDPAVAPGALTIHGAAIEVSHDWQARLPELRAAIEAALTGGDE